MSRPATTDAIVIDRPGSIARRAVGIVSPGASDVVVEVDVSGISTGTEKLLWQGDMPAFPGLSYPLVPGYESVGRIVEGGADTSLEIGTRVFVPGSSGYADGVAGLFGANAATLVVPQARVVPVGDLPAAEASLLALAATSLHALAVAPRRRGDEVTLETLAAEAPSLIVGHGVVGRLLARIVVASGAPAPLVWETSRARRDGATGYDVIDPADDPGARHARIVDASGAGAEQLDSWLSRLARGGRLTLAGFYARPLSFDFAPAFMREAVIDIAAEWAPGDLALLMRLVEDGKLSLAGLVTHTEAVADAAHAYPEAFRDPERLKTVLDWNQR